MKSSMPSYSALAMASIVLASSTFLAAHAQSFCASDGQPEPVALLERFISADCETCWADGQAPRAGERELALDWVLPSIKGDDAPLSAVASRDALQRLEALGAAPVTASWSRKTAIPRQTGSLRVAHGLPLGDYLGTSIELKPVPRTSKVHSWTAWLAMVETLPAGTENSPIERNLVRNVLQTNWSNHTQLLNKEQRRFFEARSMRLAEGVNPARIRVVGWVEDEKGHVVKAAQSRCAATAG